MFAAFEHLDIAPSNHQGRFWGMRGKVLAYFDENDRKNARDSCIFQVNLVCYEGNITVC
jgi:hypothetical protein